MARSRSGGALAFKMLQSRTPEDYPSAKQTVELSGPEGAPIASTVGYSPTIVVDKDGRRVIVDASGKRLGLADPDVRMPAPPAGAMALVLPEAEEIDDTLHPAPPAAPEPPRPFQPTGPNVDLLLLQVDPPRVPTESPPHRPPQPDVDVTDGRPDEPSPPTSGPSSPMASLIARERAKDHGIVGGGRGTSW